MDSGTLSIPYSPPRLKSLIKVGLLLNIHASLHLQFITEFQLKQTVKYPEREVMDSGWHPNCCSRIHFSRLFVFPNRKSGKRENGITGK